MIQVYLGEIPLCHGMEQDLHLEWEAILSTSIVCRADNTALRKAVEIARLASTVSVGSCASVSSTCSLDSPLAHGLQHGTECLQLPYQPHAVHLAPVNSPAISSGTTSSYFSNWISPVKWGIIIIHCLSLGSPRKPYTAKRQKNITGSCRVLETIG